MKWYGNIGFSIMTNHDDIYEQSITERVYKGELIKHSVHWQQSTDSTNDDLNLSNQISVIADDFAYENIGVMKYVDIMGCKWKIKSAELAYPRITLTIGGVWNG